MLLVVKLKSNRLQTLMQQENKDFLLLLQMIGIILFQRPIG